MSQDSVNNGGTPTRSQTQPAAESTRWTRSENKAFEQALAIIPEDMPDRWERIADHVPGKSPAEVRVHYETLLHDLYLIESGRVELPSYNDDSEEEEENNKYGKVADVPMQQFNQNSVPPPDVPMQEQSQEMQ